MKSHTAKNVEAQVKAAAPELTKLAKHRVALAYALACGNKTASTSTARRRMVEAFLTMPTFALQSLYDMHSASTKTAAEEEMPPADDAAPTDAPPADDLGGGEDLGGEDLGGGEGGDDLGGMDLGGGGGGMGGGMGAPAPADSTLDTTALKQENAALVGNIQELENNVQKLQEALPSGTALDLSSLLSEEALQGKEEQLPSSEEGGEEEDPGLDLTADNIQDFNPAPAEGEGEGMAKAASRFGAEDTEDSFEMALLSQLQGVDTGEQKSDPALPEEVEPILNQVDVEEPDFIDLPENILSDMNPPAGAQGGGPAMPKAAAKSPVKKVASVATGGARILPSGTVKPAAADDQQVSRLASLLNQFGE